MQIPQFLLDESEIVEVLGAGHFPTTVMVQNTKTSQKYEADLQKLRTLTNTQLRSLQCQQS